MQRYTAVVVFNYITVHCVLTVIKGKNWGESTYRKDT
jgi:hypothetical protein